MALQRFRAKLEGPVGGGYYITVKPQIARAFGRKALTPVRGTVNGTAYRSSIMPRGDGSFYMVLNKQLREEAGVQPGSTIAVEMQIDDAPREVEVPDDLRSALDRSPKARAAFERLSHSHRKEYVDWINEAKRQETRERRIAKAVEMIAKAKKLR